MMIRGSSSKELVVTFCLVALIWWGHNSKVANPWTVPPIPSGAPRLGIWKVDANATFYGGNEASGTIGGACGYGDLYSMGYGTNTVAISTTLFNFGASCGACYEIMCWNESKWCLRGNPSVMVTVTDFCPPNWFLPSIDGAGSESWCNPPNKHFHLAQPAFQKIAIVRGGIAPVRYRRVRCAKKGGIRFKMNGSPHFNLVLVFNVGGVGEVAAMYIKGTRTGWMQMKRNWGVSWEMSTNLVGQALSFRVITSDARSSISYNAVPSHWRFGQTFVGSQF